MEITDFRISKFLLKLGKHLEENKREDIIVTVVVLLFLFYQVGYQIGKLVSYLSHTL